LRDINKELEDVKHQIEMLEAKKKDLEDLTKIQITNVTGPRASDSRLLPVPRVYKEFFQYRRGIEWKQTADNKFELTATNDPR